MAIIPGSNLCVSSEGRVFFTDLQVAVTGVRDAEGRPETLVMQRLVKQEGDLQPFGLQGRLTFLNDMAFPEKEPWPINTAFDGCIFEKVYAPPGRVLKFLASVPCCSPEIVDGGVTAEGKAFQVLRTCQPKVAEMLLTIPEATESAALEHTICHDITLGFGKPIWHGLSEEVRGQLLQESVLQR